VPVPLLIGSRTQGTWSKVGRAASVEAHGGHVHNTRRPVRTFPEHVSCSEVDRLELQFGPDLGRSGSWA
jgi:hypothetical protein